MPKITLVNEGVMHCRMRGIYRRYLKNDIEGMKYMIKETLSIIDDAVENELDDEATDFYYEMLQRMLVEVAMKRYMSAQCRLRTMAYMYPLVALS